MKSVFIVGFIFISIVAKSQEGWVRYKTVETPGFQILAPQEMDLVTKDLKTALGDMTTYTYKVQPPETDPNYLYLVNVISYPLQTFPSDSIELIETFLSESIITASHSVAGEIAYKADIPESSNGTGKIFRITYKDGDAIMKGKVYLYNDTFYTLQVFTIKDKSLNDEMNTFLDSFKIIE